METGGLKFEFDGMEVEESVGAILKVVGVGGCGCNIIDDMYSIGVQEAELIGVNTDTQSLSKKSANEKLQIGKKITKGAGAGNVPERGEKAAEEDREVIENKLRGTDMLFITAGLGGGTGTGAAPVIADIARSLDILTVAAVITPTDSEMENKEKRKSVEEAMRKLREKVNNIIVISNQKINELCRGVSIFEAYREINKVLINIINGIVDMITKAGDQNIDFEDVKTTLKKKGDIFIGVGRAGGTDRAKKAFDMAMHNPFIGEVELKGAKNILVNFRGNITVDDMDEIQRIIEKTGAGVDQKRGIVNDQELGDDIEVVVLVSGINEKTGEHRTEEEETKGAKFQIFARQMMENGYDNVDIPTYERYSN